MVAFGQRRGSTLVYVCSLFAIPIFHENAKSARSRKQHHALRWIVIMMPELAIKGPNV
ncbi:hypothetical protein J2776_002796 [Paraburkholderia caledonica]|uniref:Transposase n=1 Tax=Paraburkholderia caledonica TaxID=134536 RepID=A0ABU1KYP9_9BURK|nr:hypothetical protein [Paraburkholderia caledonica]